MNIVVPQLGESVIEARVARWLKREGEAIAAGEPLVELETDKIDLEVNAEAAGVLSHIERKDGEDVKVGEVLGVMEAGAKAPAASAGRSEAPPVAASAATPSAERSEGPSAGALTPTPARAKATARKIAEQHGVHLQ